jgi:hypothetical protein
MDYTLDSKVHVVECLKKKLNIERVTEEPVLLNLDEIKNHEENVFYFGVLTVGSNIETVKLNLFNINFIDIETNSQIIGLFKYIDIIKIENDLKFPKGQFRGFRLNAESTSFIPDNPDQYEIVRKS